MPRKPAKHPAKPKRGKKLEIEEPGVLYGRYSSHNQKDISVEQQFEKGYELAAEYGIRIRLFCASNSFCKYIMI